MPNRSRFVLGTHLYGMDWPAGGGPANKATALEYADVRAPDRALRGDARARPGGRRLDVHLHRGRGVPHEVWYPDATTIARRVRLLATAAWASGSGAWAHEDQRIWDDPQIAPGTAWP